MTAVALVTNALMWADGSLAVGEFSRIRLADSGYLVIGLATYHHLSHVAGRSFWRFRPLLSISETAASTLEYDLTTMPRSLGWAAVLAGFLVALQGLRTDPIAFGLGPRVGIAAAAYVYVFTMVAFSVMGALVIQTMRQLGQVSRLHKQATDLNLFRLRPLHAFATLTSRTGLGLAVFMVYNASAEAGNLNTANTVGLIGVGFLAVVVFVAPLLGMRGRLVEEKARMLHTTNEALELTINRVHEQVNADAHDRMDGLSTTLNTLVVERDLIRGISTWPWEQGTARGFASTLLIPIVVWLVTRLLEKFV